MSVVSGLVESEEISIDELKKLISEVGERVKIIYNQAVNKKIKDMKLKILLIFILSCALSSCFRGDKLSEISFEAIDIKSAFDNKSPVNIDDIAVNYEYIVLESSDECLVGSDSKVYSDEKNIVVIDRTQILLFDRNSGSFVRRIGNIGNGPGEYSRTYAKMPYNYEKKTVYARNNTERLEYSLDGEFMGSKIPPDVVYDFVDLGNKTYAAFIDNYIGDEKNKIILFDEQDSIIKIFPNYLSFQFNGSINVYTYNAWFSRINGITSFCERFNDTLFYLTPEKLEPRYVFNKGYYFFPYELRGNSINISDKYFFTENVLESQRYLFYVFVFNSGIYTSVYDKEKKETVVNDYVAESGKGFINNINGFVPIELSSINNSGELLGVIDAFKISQWFGEHGEEVERLPESLKELEKIKEMDNPVVIIAELRD